MMGMLKPHKKAKRRLESTLDLLGFTPRHHTETFHQGGEPKASLSFIRCCSNEPLQVFIRVFNIEPILAIENKPIARLK